MKKILIAFALIFPLLSISLFLGKVSAEAPIDPPKEIKTSWTIEEVKVMVDYYADMHGVSRTTMHKVVKCESGYNYKAVNMQDSHKLSQGSHGVAQFSRETFIGFAKQMHKYYTDPYNPEQALDVAAWAISKGYGNHWSCFRK